MDTSSSTTNHLDPRVEADSKQRELCRAAIVAEQGKLGRRLTGREKSVLWSKFAPHFRIVQPPKSPWSIAVEIGDPLEVF